MRRAEWRPGTEPPEKSGLVLTCTWVRSDYRDGWGFDLGWFIKHPTRGEWIRHGHSADAPEGWVPLPDEPEPMDYTGRTP